MGLASEIGVWTNLVLHRRSMRVESGPRPGGRPDATSAAADFSSSPVTNDVQPDSAKSPSMEWPRAPALLVRTPVRPSTDAPTANTLSKLELGRARFRIPGRSSPDRRAGSRHWTTMTTRILRQGDRTRGGGGDVRGLRVEDD